ncbi:MAG: flagellar basal body P-ring formation chaperone FlgA [Alphaproteobacteria bacterium]|nr:flagellar basal body P-ring formation chaperone FlgA [Alphaproteobacteria bacterium]
MRKTTRILFTAWLALTGSIGSPTPCVADTPVSLKSEVEVSRSAVRLSDLFLGVPAAIDRDIAHAPPACKPAVYDIVVLRKLSQTYRLDWQDQGAADQATVSAPCTRISGDKIRKAVIAKMKADPGTKKLNFEVFFDKPGLEANVPANDVTDFSLDNFTYNPVSKLFRANLTAPTPRGSYSLPVYGHIAVKRSIPVLAHRIESGSLIAPGDLDWQDVSDERITPDVITEPSQLIGREARHDTPEGQILRSRDIMPPRLVQRGSLVTMKVQTPFIIITTQGKAQQDGIEGETIRVLNTQSNRIVAGVVVAPGVVEIRTARQIALAE